MSISDAERHLIETIKLRQSEMVAIEQVRESIRLNDEEGHDVLKLVWYDLDDECSVATKELIRIRKDKERRRHR